MRDARGQLSDGLQLLGMPELSFQTEHVRYVRPVTVDDLTGDDRKKRPGDGSVVDVDYFTELLLPRSQTLADDELGAGRQDGQEIVLAKGFCHGPG